MAGNDIERLNEFVRNLTGRNENLELSNLSSAQKARVIAWADTNGISLNSGSISSKVPSAAPPTMNSHEISFSTEQSIGIDIQSCNELFPEKVKDLKSSDELLKIFTLRELAYAENKPETYTTLTGLFAAKEAIIKANNLLPNKLNEIEIQFNKDGKPFYIHSEISISHSLDFAIAVAISKTSQNNSRSTTQASEKKSFETTQNAQHSDHQFKKANKTTKRNSNSFRLLSVLTLSIILLVLGFGFGIYFESLLK